MKHSDQQRVNKIYEYASKLTEYVRNNNITREALLTDFSLLRDALLPRLMPCEIDVSGIEV